VYASIRDALGDEIFFSLYGDWRAAQAGEIRSNCTSDERAVFVATADGAPVGFVSIWLNAFFERLGVIDIIGVSPEHQRQGIAERLTEVALEHMHKHGMTVASVETGGDPGHAPARALYERTGFKLLPIARYFRTLP